MQTVRGRNHALNSAAAFTPLVRSANCLHFAFCILNYVTCPTVAKSIVF